LGRCSGFRSQCLLCFFCSLTICISTAILSDVPSQELKDSLISGLKSFHEIPDELARNLITNGVVNLDDLENLTEADLRSLANCTLIEAKRIAAVAPAAAKAIREKRDAEAAADRKAKYDAEVAVIMAAKAEAETAEKMKAAIAAEVKAEADAEAYKATAEERAAKAAEMEARKVIEDQLRSQMDPPLIALLSEHGLLVEVGQILIKEAGVTTLKDLNELSVDDLVSVGISHAAASKIQDIGLKLRAQIKGTMEEISEKAGPCKVS
jgi:hypothetical protein